MFDKNDLRLWDIGVFAAANVINILLTIIFIVRAQAGTRDTPIENLLGLFVLAMAIPLSLAVITNIINKRGAWYWALPAVTVLFLAVEMILDYLLRIDFRSTWLITPYLILFYLSQFGMVGYSFFVGKTYGFITLVTYFINLAATFVSYALVRHG